MLPATPAVNMDETAVRNSQTLMCLNAVEDRAMDDVRVESDCNGQSIGIRRPPVPSSTF